MVLFLFKTRSVLETGFYHRLQMESAHVSLVDNPISQSSLDISPIWTLVIATQIRKLQLRAVWIMWENCVFMLVPYRKFVSLLILTIVIKQCMDIGARPHVYGVFKIFFNVCLNSPPEDGESELR
jgi:hypothetical protein